MPTYRVTYAHEDALAPNDKERHGWAMQEVQVDHEITAEADLKEVARTIAMESGYTSVAITKTELRLEEEEDVD